MNERVTPIFWQSMNKTILFQILEYIGDYSVIFHVIYTTLRPHINRLET